MTSCNVEGYLVQELIGEGAYGVVHSAVDNVTRKKVAIKTIKSLFNHPVITLRTLREIQLLRQLRHDNILELNKVIIDGSVDSYSSLYVVTGLLDSDLACVLANQQLTIEHVRFFAFQLLRGLQHMHSLGVIHRDLKPRNLFVNEQCDLRIGDFGMARTLRDISHKPPRKILPPPPPTTGASASSCCCPVSSSTQSTAATVHASSSEHHNNNTNLQSINNIGACNITTSNNPHNTHNSYCPVHNNSQHGAADNNHLPHAIHSTTCPMFSSTLFCDNLSDPDLTRYVATRWYRAPELLLFSSSYGSPVDMWAVGCIIAEMILRVPLFRGSNTADQLSRVCAVLGGLTEEDLDCLSASENAKKSVRKLGLMQKQPDSSSQVKFYNALKASGGFIPSEEFAKRSGYGPLNSSSAVASIAARQQTLRSLLVRARAPTEAIDLVEKLLKIKPTERLSANQALLHPFFKELTQGISAITEEKFSPSRIELQGGSGASSQGIDVPQLRMWIVEEQNRVSSQLWGPCSAIFNSVCGGEIQQNLLLNGASTDGNTHFQYAHKKSALSSENGISSCNCAAMLTQTSESQKHNSQINNSNKDSTSVSGFSRHSQSIVPTHQSVTHSKVSQNGVLSPNNNCINHENSMTVTSNNKNNNDKYFLHSPSTNNQSVSIQATNQKQEHELANSIEPSTRRSALMKSLENTQVVVSHPNENHSKNLVTSNNNGNGFLHACCGAGAVHSSSNNALLSNNNNNGNHYNSTTTIATNNHQVTSERNQATSFRHAEVPFPSHPLQSVSLSSNSPSPKHHNTNENSTTNYSNYHQHEQQQQQQPLIASGLNSHGRSIHNSNNNSTHSSHHSSNNVSFLNKDETASPYPQRQVHQHQSHHFESHPSSLMLGSQSTPNSKAATRSNRTSRRENGLVAAIAGFLGGGSSRNKSNSTNGNDNCIEANKRSYRDSFADNSHQMRLLAANDSNLSHSDVSNTADDRNRKIYEGYHN